MNKKILLLLLLIFGSYAAWYLYKKTTKKSEIAFNIENTLAIDKIIISQAGKKPVVLTKNTNSTWIVNKKYNVSLEKIDILLEQTMKKISIKGPISKSAQANVIAAMASTAIKAEFYSGTNKEKCIYVGGSTNDMMGTIMHLEGESIPYITFVPGFDGFLSTRFIINEDDWIDKMYLNFKKNEITKIIWQYDNPNESIILESNIQNQFTLNQKEIDPTVAEKILDQFEGKYCEGIEPLNKARYDSINRNIPFCSIQVFTKNNHNQDLKFYDRIMHQGGRTVFDKNGNPLIIDPERFILISSHLDRIMLAQKTNTVSLLIKDLKPN